MAMIGIMFACLICDCGYMLVTGGLAFEMIVFTICSIFFGWVLDIILDTEHGFIEESKISEGEAQS